ncbi:MAG TPA: BlaI/MecI/CopY family transcriptional regulator [Caulobacteraceae bacterium]|nr:BlaI/MecI/CopY family transcriptional regulator [Caulobacteraceae bacterium]
MATQPRERASGVLTPLELEIMQVLWDGGASTVADVQGRLKGELAYTTVQTMLTVLLRKKKVRRTAVGRAFAYEPAITREGAVKSTVTDLVARMFGGSSEALLMALVDTRQITPEQLERAARLLQDSEKARDKDGEGGE